MQGKKGAHIAIEGIDAVGKSALVEMLARELQAKQTPVQTVTDNNQPQTITAQAIRRIIDDPRYPLGSRAEVLLYNAARSQALGAIQKIVESGAVCLTDSSYLTTLVTEYYGHGSITNYETAGQIIQFAAGHVPPDLVIVLDTPASNAAARVQSTQRASLDEAYLERVRAGYLWEARQRNLPVVYATDTIDAVFAAVWQQVSAFIGALGREGGNTRPQSVAEVLAANPPTKAAPAEPPITANIASAPAPNLEQTQTATPTANTKATDHEARPATEPAEPLVQKHDNGSDTITDVGKTELAKRVTNIKGPVYMLTDAVSRFAATAAMAQINYGNDVRLELLNEPAGQTNELTGPLQLTDQYIVIEDASSLLREKLTQDKQITCFEPSMNRARLNQKGADGHYRYYTPPKLTNTLRRQYTQTMDQILDTHFKLLTQLTTYIRDTSSTSSKERDAAWQESTETRARSAIRGLLPIATKSTVGMHVSSQTLEDLIARFLSDELPEVRAAGEQILAESGKVFPATPVKGDTLGRIDEAAVRLAKVYAGTRRLTQELLPPNHTAESEPVTLVGVAPRNELDIIADILYEHSDLPLEQLQNETRGWPYQRKVDVLTTYIGEHPSGHHKPGYYLEKIRYSFDLVCDYDTFRNLQRQRLTSGPERQSLSPRLGYSVPQLVEEAGVVDAFEQCFDLSLQLCSTLQAAGYPLEAQYATLLGHNTRCRVTYNAREAFQLHGLKTDTQASSGYRKLVQEMYEKVAEVHPLLADAMRFTDHNESSTSDHRTTEKPKTRPHKT